MFKHRQNACMHGIHNMHLQAGQPVRACSCRRDKEIKACKPFGLMMVRVLLAAVTYDKVFVMK